MSRRNSAVKLDDAPGGDDKEFAWDWENESNPLVAKGKGPPKFIGPIDKHNANEGDNAYIAFQIEGDPVPSIGWFKGFKDLKVEPRYKMWTDGAGGNNVILGVNQCRQEEEGGYKCVLTNDHGEEEFEFKFFVTVEGGMDFRAMLMKRKKPQKKVVVKKIEWLEKPEDQEVQQGKVDKVVIAAKLSETNKKGKWYIRNNETFKDVRAGDHGLELRRDKEKYAVDEKDGVYTLTIFNPTVADGGKYSIVVRIEKDTYVAGAYLDVKDADPEYYFDKKLRDKTKGYTNRTAKMKCVLNQSGAKIQWLKNGTPITIGDGHYDARVNGTKLSLFIDNCTMDDYGIYTCRIKKFVKEGEDDETNTTLAIEEFPHKFASQLKGKNVIEHDRTEFEIDVEESDAEVTWFHDGKPIVPDDKRVFVVKEGKKRKLIIKDTLLTDSGEISVKTNTDKSKCNLVVQHENRFLTTLPNQLKGVERESFSVTVQVKDPNAPVAFYIGGKRVTAGDERTEAVNLGDGKHQLVVRKCKMSDLGILEAVTPSNRGDDVKCTAQMHVEKGEDAPEIDDCDPVKGIAHKDCNWSMKYRVNGKQQSPLEVIVMKDGKELKIGKHVNVNIHGTAIDLSVINPRREKSGIYTVILRNAQGECQKDIEVNIMDKPTPPKTCTVTDVFYDNCVVNWTPPEDDGGTALKKYVVEALDVTHGTDSWRQVARTDNTNDRKIKVEGLTHRHRYRFRVRAANKLGASDPCEMDGDDILIKDPWDEPTAPGKPNIEDWGPDRCDLSWKIPDSDGGAPITHYEIEYMEKSLGMWEHGITLQTKDVKNIGGLLHGTCPGLVEGSEYVFRIKAVNKGGPSPPSPQSESMIAKTRFIKPFIHQPGMYDIEVKKGRTFRYDIWFGGEPPPTILWERNGSMITSDERTSLELFSKKTVYCERNTVLTVTKAVRAVDGGRYKIKLVCEAGTFEATGFVNVLDIPQKPRAFNPDEVRAEHIKLSWAPPDDDGGTPITSYIVRMMDLEVGEWITFTETKPTVLTAMAKGLKPGHLYQFEVCAVNKEGESLPARTKDPLKAENPYKPPSQPKEPKIVDFDNQSVTLRWSKPENDGGRPITHYIIQKKDKFGGWFDALVTDDNNCCAVIDELEARIPGLSEGKYYQFRIVAVNKAGESWPSLETKPHLCRHKNLRPSIDHAGSGSKTVKINRSAIWHIKCKGEPPPKFSWYKDGELLGHCDEIKIETDEYQGGATAMMQVVKAKMGDAGKYTLVAENRNGKDAIDLDLIVLDLMQDCECDMFKTGSLQCTCSSGFRLSELSAQQVLEVDFGP